MLLRNNLILFGFLTVFSLESRGKVCSFVQFSSFLIETIHFRIGGRRFLHENACSVAKKAAEPNNKKWNILKFARRERQGNFSRKTALYHHLLFSYRTYAVDSYQFGNK